MGGTCTHFPGFTGRCPADWATHLKNGRSGVIRTRVVSIPSRVPELLGYAPKNWMRVSESHRRASWLMRPDGDLALPAKIGGGSRFCSALSWSSATRHH